MVMDGHFASFCYQQFASSVECLATNEKPGVGERSHESSRSCVPSSDLISHDSPTHACPATLRHARHLPSSGLSTCCSHCLGHSSPRLAHSLLFIIFLTTLPFQGILLNSGHPITLSKTLPSTHFKIPFPDPIFSPSVAYSVPPGVGSCGYIHPEMASGCFQPVGGIVKTV